MLPHRNLVTVFYANACAKMVEAKVPLPGRSLWINIYSKRFARHKDICTAGTFWLKLLDVDLFWTTNHTKLMHLTTLSAWVGMLVRGRLFQEATKALTFCSTRGWISGTRSGLECVHQYALSSSLKKIKAGKLWHSNSFCHFSPNSLMIPYDREP